MWGNSWDNLYVNEISNHAHDPEDRGTVWFDDSDAEAKMIAFLNRLDPLAEAASDDSDSDGDGDGDDEAAAGAGNQDSSSSSSSLPRLNQKTTTFLDLGTGNGSLLFGLRDAGWQGKMLGVDYSAKSVEFARQIARSRRAEDEDEDQDQDQDDEEHEQQGQQDDNTRHEGAHGDDIEFREYDILNGRPETLLPSTVPPAPPSSGSTTISRQGDDNDRGAATTTIRGGEEGWDVILDKGTFDAISLYSSTSSHSQENTATTTRRPNEGYKAAVLPLVREGGLFLITSCNWTEDELARWFEGDDDIESKQQQQQWRFKKVGRVNYPTFSFGGIKGQTISTLCFVKVRR